MSAIFPRKIFDNMTREIAEMFDFSTYEFLAKLPRWEQRMISAGVDICECSSLRDKKWKILASALFSDTTHSYETWQSYNVTIAKSDAWGNSACNKTIWLTKGSAKLKTFFGNSKSSDLLYEHLWTSNKGFYKSHYSYFPSVVKLNFYSLPLIDRRYT